jgi:N-acetylmuramoyl-L-alanine amidase/type II secretory pathway predicted ATPase ExeA
MILNFYGLREQPFGVTPDPAYLYPSHTHCAALDSLTDAILTDRGFMALIAEPGMGKTTLLQQVLEGMREKARGVFLFQTQCDSREFFQYLMSELGVDFTRMSLVSMHNKLNEILFSEMLAGRRFVLIVDEAQNLQDSVLETIRMLSNFETTHAKLMQIVLAGQPQLGDKLQQRHMAQLFQRLTVIQHLEHFSPEETAGYIRHRLKVAGYPGDMLFDPFALARIAEESRGVPRDINKICFRTLLEGYAADAPLIGADLVEKAIGRLKLVPRSRPQSVLAESAAPVTAPAPPKVALAASLAVSPEPPKVVPISPNPNLTYPVTKRSRWKAWGTRTSAAIALFFAGSLLLPHSAISRVSESLRQKISATRSFVQRGAARATGRSSESIVSVVRQPQFPSAAASNLSGTSPAFTVNNALPYNGPEQAYFDLNRAAVASSTPQRDPLAASDPRYSLARELGLKVSRIAIDPGHGGYDTGTTGPRGLLEKDLCLDVSLRLGQLIQKNLPGTEVVYTRTDDRHVSLEERTALANDANADLFISVHANSSDFRYIRGAETFYLSLADSAEARDLASRENAFSESSLHELPDLLRKIARNDKVVESRQLAADIQQSLAAQLQTVSRQESDRGVKHAPFLVLTGANMPAVLSEISFVSNAADERLLSDPAQRQRIAEALFRGISSYLSRTTSTPAPATQKQAATTALTPKPL